MSEIWKTRSCDVLLDRPPWFEVSVEEVELPGGKIVSDYHQIRMPHFTAVFAVTQDQNIMVMRCYRHAVGEVTLTMPGGMLEAERIPAIPSPENPMPGQDPYFTGGYSTHEHGSLSDTELVSGIQLEHHFVGVRDSDANRRAYAAVLARVIRDYMLEHMGCFEPN